MALTWLLWTGLAGRGGASKACELDGNVMNVTDTEGVHWLRRTIILKNAYWKSFLEKPVCYTGSGH